MILVLCRGILRPRKKGDFTMKVVVYPEPLTVWAGEGAVGREEALFDLSVWLPKLKSLHIEQSVLTHNTRRDTATYSICGRLHATPRAGIRFLGTPQRSVDDT